MLMIFFLTLPFYVVAHTKFGPDVTKELYSSGKTKVEVLGELLKNHFISLIESEKQQVSTVCGSVINFIFYCQQ